MNFINLLNPHVDFSVDYPPQIFSPTPTRSYSNHVAGFGFLLDEFGYNVDTPELYAQPAVERSFVSPASQRDDSVSNNDDDGSTAYDDDGQNRNANPGWLPPVRVIYPAYERDRFEVNNNYKYGSSIAYDLFLSTT